MLNGKPHGKGTITYKDGTIYTGDWAKGKSEGYGEVHLMFFIYRSNLLTEVNT